MSLNPLPPPPDFPYRFVVSPIAATCVGLRALLFIPCLQCTAAGALLCSAYCDAALCIAMPLVRILTVTRSPPPSLPPSLPAPLTTAPSLPPPFSAGMRGSSRESWRKTVRSISLNAGPLRSCHATPPPSSLASATTAIGYLTPETRTRSLRALTPKVRCRCRALSSSVPLRVVASCSLLLSSSCLCLCCTQS